MTPSPPGPPWATARKALSLALAAWLSFAIASMLHVHHAYWAAMPVWVLTQSSRGLVMERAAFRIIGTLIGALAGFALVNSPAPPAVQIVVLSLWIAINAGLIHVLRGGAGYGAMLAGMTAAVVVIPSLLSPSGSMALAVARVECTLIGVIVATVVLALLTPESPLAEFYARMRTVSADAVAHAARVLREGVSAGHGGEERRILARISNLDASARTISAGSVAGYRRLGAVDLMIVGSLTAMAAAQAARLQGTRCDARLPMRLDRIAEGLRGATDVAGAEAERPDLRFDEPALARLDAAVGQILDADLALRGPDAAAPSAPGPRRAWLAPHREWPLAWRAGAMAGVASLVASALGLWSDWPPMHLAALGVCIFVMVLGSMPVPQLIAPQLLAGVVAGAVIAVFYRLAVQPAIGSTTGLLLTIAPFLLAGGFARASPRIGPAGVDANMCFLLASQAGMPATGDLVAIFGDALALVLAALVMAGGFMLLPRRAQRQAADAAAVIRRDLQRIVESRAGGDPVDWHARGSRQILRLTLHLGRSEGLGERWPEELLAALNLGQAMIDLQELGMPDAARELVLAFLQRRRPPREIADALHALADAAADDAPGRAIRTLATLIVPAAGLVTFGPAPARRSRQAPGRVTGGR